MEARPNTGTPVIGVADPQSGWVQKAHESSPCMFDGL